MNQITLIKRFKKLRSYTEKICTLLETEDYVVQPITNVSPPKWHLAHTTWFFEEFILVKHLANYKVFDENFAFLFNSYYNNVGERTQRENRGFMTRPTVKRIYEYRNYVTEAVEELLTKKNSDEIFKLIEIGIHHEEQHQELLIYDIKYILGNQPTFPSLKNFPKFKANHQDLKWVKIEEGLYNVGAKNNKNFSYDNEKPSHQQYIKAFNISNQLVSNKEYLEFIEDKGYENFNLWHDDGWQFINEQNINKPLYWHFKDGVWWQYTLNGLQKLNLNEPVAHISLYEAAALAEWKGKRLPTEFEWEVAADKLSWGQLWEWTNSAYLPYTGYEKEEGALGEYNGKFMVNQHVLRGSSIVTSKNHSRKTYRNFFHPSSRWIFSGIRLVNK